MRSYLYQSFPFKKEWVWFSKPHEREGVDITTFFSYDDVAIKEFKKKKGETLLLDLKKSKDELWEGMRKKMIRKQIEKGERNGIVVKKMDDFSLFYPIYLSFRKKKELPKEKYTLLEENGELYLAWYQNKVIAGGIFITDERYMRAWVLASQRLTTHDGVQREIIGQANRMLLWEAIQSGKALGREWFDFGGARFSSDDKEEQALLEFKGAFGGVRKEVFYYTKIYSRLLRMTQKYKSRMKL